MVERLGRGHGRGQHSRGRLTLLAHGAAGSLKSHAPFDSMISRFIARENSSRISLQCGTPQFTDVWTEKTTTQDKMIFT